MAIKKPITVYWAINSEPNAVTLTNLIWEPPIPFFSTLPELSQDTKNFKMGNYAACSGSRPIFNNTYVLKNPFSVEATFSGRIGEPTITTDKNVWLPRSSSFKNSYAVDYDLGWIFFSEEPVTVRVTGPHMHKPFAQEYGSIAAGQFDISKWYRPVRLTYHLWEGVTTLKLKEGDILAYLEFMTESNKKVVLKQYENIPELISMVYQTNEVKNYLPNKSLEDLYNRFTRTNRNKRVLKLIKENLL